jgi:hypothetical protein
MPGLGRSRNAWVVALPGLVTRKLVTRFASLSTLSGWNA